MRRVPLAALLAAGLGLVFLHDGAPAAVLAQSAAVPDVIYVPTPQAVVDAMLALAEVTRNDIVYDLGSGDGRIVITAAKKYGARGVGIEIDPALVNKATENAAAAGVSDRVRFVTGNLFSSDISEATVVTLYLLQSINERLRPKLVRELKPRTRVVSHVFNMGPEWPPEKTLVAERRPIFLWTIPDRFLKDERTTPGRAAAQPPASDTQNARAQAQEEEELARVGETTTDRVCSTSCHTFDEITRTRRTARDWSDMVTSMATQVQGIDKTRIEAQPDALRFN